MCICMYAHTHLLHVEEKGSRHTRKERGRRGCPVCLDDSVFHGQWAPRYFLSSFRLQHAEGPLQRPAIPHEALDEMVPAALTRNERKWLNAAKPHAVPQRLCLWNASGPETYSSSYHGLRLHVSPCICSPQTWGCLSAILSHFLCHSGLVARLLGHLGTSIRGLPWAGAALGGSWGQLGFAWICCPLRGSEDSSGVYLSVGDSGGRQGFLVPGAL